MKSSDASLPYVDIRLFRILGQRKAKGLVFAQGLFLILILSLDLSESWYKIHYQACDPGV